MTLQTETARKRTMVGIQCVVGAMLCFSAMDVVIKMLADDRSYGPAQILVWRNVVALLPVALYVRLGPGLRSLKTSNKRLHFLRSQLTALAFISFTMALKKMKLADATAVSFAAPLIITALSVPLLREHVGVHRWSAVLVGFVGVMITLRPGAGVFLGGGMFALAAAVFYAGAMIVGRILSRSEPSSTIVFYNIVGSSLIPFVAVVATGLALPAIEHLHLFVLVGLIGSAGQVALTQAYRFAPASVIAPFDYTALLWATGLGYIFWRELPDRLVVLGSVIVIASGLYIWYREVLRQRA